MDAASAASHFQALAGKATTPTPQGVSLSEARSAGRAISNLVQNRGGAAYLSNNVALFLIGVFDAQSEQLVDKQVQYQQLDQ